MNPSLLGLTLEAALRELAERGVTHVTANRLTAPPLGTDPGQPPGEWRVVRVNGSGPVTLDVCYFTGAVV